MENYVIVEGSQSEILASDTNTVPTELDIVKFNISTTASTYAAEFKTTEYHKKLFDEIKLVEEMWNNIKSSAKKYHMTFEYIPEPESPIQMNAFDSEGQSQTAIVADVSTASYSSGKVNIGNGILNLRKTPDGEVLTTLKKGADLKVFGIDSSNEWLYVSIEGFEGYVHSDYVIIDNNFSQDCNYTINTNNEFVSIKLNPNVDSESLCILSNNSEIKVLEYNPDSAWQKVEIFGKEAYVETSSLKARGE